MVVALKILHIALAAAWFGHKLLIPGDIKQSAALSAGESPTFLVRLGRAQVFGIIAGLGTLAAGSGLAFAVDAETVSLGVWIGATFVVAAIAVGAVLGRPAAIRLKRAVLAGDRVEATVAGRRLSSVLGLESVLWLAALTGMVI